jgi:hypothetical protein
MIRLADSKESRHREARKARLSDARLLDVFMVTRRACLAEGRSVVEASERAHEAVDAAERTHTSQPATVTLPGGESRSETDGL